MQVTIGSIIPLRGKRFFVDEIVSEKRQQLAQEWTVGAYSSRELVSQGRISYISQTNCAFEVGDIVSIEWERLGLREVNGVDWHTIYTYHNVKKERTDGSQRDESGDRPAADSAAESSREGGEDRSGLG